MIAGTIIVWWTEVRSQKSSLPGPVRLPDTAQGPSCRPTSSRRTLISG